MSAGVVIWSGGRLVDPRETVVTAVDHGLTVGDGVFETCAVLRGQAFALTRHLRRLRRSATGLGLPAPDEDLIRDGIRAVLTAAGDGAGRVRVTVTAGPSASTSEEASEKTTGLWCAGGLPLGFRLLPGFGFGSGFHSRQRAEVLGVVR